MHQIPKVECFMPCLAVVFALSTEVKNEDVVGAGPTGNAPNTAEWSTSLLPTKLLLVLQVWWYVFQKTITFLTIDKIIACVTNMSDVFYFFITDLIWDVPYKLKWHVTAGYLVWEYKHWLLEVQLMFSCNLCYMHSICMLLWTFWCIKTLLLQCCWYYLAPDSV